MFLQLLSYFGAVFGFLFLTLSIASGLYYISELVEEHSEPTKRFLTRAIYVIIGIFLLLLLFDSFPFKLSVFSIVSYAIYLQNLTKFPFISLKSLTFLLSCVLVVLNHYLWFKYFNDIKIPPQFRFDPNYVPRRRASFTEVASFFGICVWFIPFALFVSLSAGDNVLPMTTKRLDKKDDNLYAEADGPRFRKRATGLVRVVIDGIRNQFYTIARVFGYNVNPQHGRLVM